MINPQAQLRYGALFLAVAILVHAVATALMWRLYTAWQAEALAASSIAISTLIAALVLSYVLLYGFALGLSIVLTHRLYGPLVAFDRALEQLEAGHLDMRITLRQNDEVVLRRMADRLNILAQRLQRQQS